MNIINIAEATRADDGSLAVTWLDTNGLKRHDKLSERATAAVLWTLLGGRVGKPGTVPEGPVFHATGVRALTTDRPDLVVLEFIIGNPEQGNLTLKLGMSVQLKDMLRDRLIQEPREWLAEKAN